MEVQQPASNYSTAATTVTETTTTTTAAPAINGGSVGGCGRMNLSLNSSRIIRVSRGSGGKDRHSKVWTAKGPRDRRVRLSVPTAIQFYDLQDRLGFDQPSKAVEWLINHASDSINHLPSLNTANFPALLETPNNSNNSSSSRVKARERERERTTAAALENTSSFTQLLAIGSKGIMSSSDYFGNGQNELQFPYLMQPQLQQHLGQAATMAALRGGFNRGTLQSNSVSSSSSSSSSQSLYLQRFSDNGSSSSSSSVPFFLGGTPPISSVVVDHQQQQQQFNSRGLNLYYGDHNKGSNKGKNSSMSSYPLFYETIS